MVTDKQIRYVTSGIVLGIATVGLFMAGSLLYQLFNYPSYRSSRQSTIEEVLGTYDINGDGDINSRNGELSNFLRDYKRK